MINSFRLLDHFRIQLLYNLQYKAMYSKCFRHVYIIFMGINLNKNQMIIITLFGFIPIS